MRPTRWRQSTHVAVGVVVLVLVAAVVAVVIGWFDLFRRREGR